MPQQKKGADNRPTIACFTPSLGGSLEWSLLTGISLTARSLGYRLNLQHTDNVYDENDALLSDVTSYTAGVILLPHSGSIAQKAIIDLRGRGTPVVCLERQASLESGDAIFFDNLAVGYMITTSLIKRGHGRIGLIENASERRSDRLDGYFRALQENGLKSNSPPFSMQEFRALSNEERCGRIRSWLSVLDAPTALMFINREMMDETVSIIGQLRDSTINLEMALLDCMPHSSPYSISLTAARLPIERMGEEAVKLLHARTLGDVGPPRHIVLPIQIAQRLICPQ